VFDDPTLEGVASHPEERVPRHREHGSLYYTIELLEGEDLSVTLAREGPLP